MRKKSEQGNVKRLDPPEEERRKYLKTVGALVAGLAIGGAAAWLGKPAERVEVPGATVTAPGVTVTETVTKTVTARATPTPVVGGTLIVEVPGTLGTVDPAVMWAVTEAEVLFHVYQGLMAFKDGSTSELVPLLAESWDISDDGLTYSFKIRKGVTFSNGDPLNAYCFWYTLYRTGIVERPEMWVISQAGLGSKYWERDGVTADMLNEWTKPDNTPPDDQLELVTSGNISITCPGPYQLVIRLPKPSRPFLYALTQCGGRVMSPKWVTEHGGVEAGKPNEYITLHAMGTGPFMLTKNEPGVEWVLERNPNYWGGPGTGVHDTPKLDKVVVKVVPDTLTRLGDLERGVCHLSVIDCELAEEVLKKPGLYIPSIPLMPITQVVEFNIQRPPFDNKLVRQAAVRAIDYDFVEKLFHGLAERWVLPIPKGFPCHDPTVPLYEYDPDLARSLLAQAGHPNGEGIPEVKLLFMTDRPLMGRISEIIQASLRDIGIKVALKGITASAYYPLTTNPDLDPKSPEYYDIIWTSWAWVPQEWYFVDWLIGKMGWLGGGNPGFYSDPRIEELLEKANTATKFEELKKYYSEITHIVYEEAPGIGITQYKTLCLGFQVCRENVQGFAAQATSWGSFSYCPMYLTE